jgi:hypothetical protein
MAATPELANPVYNLPGAGDTILDSAAEECSTGIALSTNEFTNTLYLTDLSQKTITGPNSWTAPQQLLSVPEFNSLAAGTTGIAVAPGSHLGIVTGEFGGNAFGVIDLPTITIANTPPGVVDYVAAQLPNTPSGLSWQQGLDPHTVTAYFSPNALKAYAVMANSPPPKFLAIVDMAALLAAPRASTTAGPPHNVYQCDVYNNASGCVDLLGAGIVRFVATGN